MSESEGATTVDADDNDDTTADLLCLGDDDCDRDDADRAAVRLGYGGHADDTDPEFAELSQCGSHGFEGEDDHRAHFPADHEQLEQEGTLWPWLDEDVEA